MHDKYLRGAAFVAAITLWQVFAFAAGTQPSPLSAHAAVEQFMDKDLIGVPGKELLMLTVEYLLGGASLPHRHDAQVFVYVLEGELSMQVAGSPAVALGRVRPFTKIPLMCSSSRPMQARLHPRKFSCSW